MGPTGRDRLNLMERIYRLLLIAYPRWRRREDGAEMGRMFSDIYRYEPESRGLVGRARLVAYTIRDLAVGALTERRSSLDILMQDLRYGARRLRDNPTMTAAAVLTLSLGIGAVTSVYSFVDALLFEPLPYPEMERVVVLGETTPQRGLNGEGWTHPAEFRRWRDLDALGSVAALRPYLVTMTGGGDPVRVVGYRATTNFFEVLGVQPFLGRGFVASTTDIGGRPETSADAEMQAVVLGYSFWRRQFGGDPDVLGWRLRLGGRLAVVIGVMPPGAEFPMGTDLWVPLVLSPQEWSSYERRSLRTIGRLAPGASVARLRAQLEPLDAVAAELHPEGHGDVRIAVEPVLENITGPLRTALALLMGAVSLLLLLVCGNVANIQLAQAAARQREMAMRMALGARRIRLVRQLLTESVMLATLSAFAGVWVAASVAGLMRIAFSQEYWRFFITGVDQIGINTSVLAFAAVVSLSSVAVFGLTPALHCSRIDLYQGLEQSSSRGPMADRLRRSLVSLQAALSVVLLVGAGLMASSIGAFTRFEPGVDTDVLSVRLRSPETSDAARRRTLFDQSLARVRGLPGVRLAATSDRTPVTGDERGTAFEVESIELLSNSDRAERHVIGGDYFETLGISVLQGRRFDNRDASGTTPVAIVSRALADRTWPGRPALGRRLRFGPDEPWRAVVGVVTDVAKAWNDARPAAAIYIPDAQSSIVRTFLIEARGSEEDIIVGMREAIWAIDDGVVVFAPRTIEQALDEQARGIPTAMRLVGWIALVALLVCLAGIYAMVSFTAARRTHEIGVRLALGAEQAGVVRMLVLQAIRMTGVGLAIGLLGAYGFARALAGIMEGVLVADPAVFFVLAACMLLLAALASWLPARRAAGVDPVVTLRAE